MCKLSSLNVYHTDVAENCIWCSRTSNPVHNSCLFALIASHTVAQLRHFQLHHIFDKASMCLQLWHACEICMNPLSSAKLVCCLSEVLDGFGRIALAKACYFNNVTFQQYRMQSTYAGGSVGSSASC